LGTPKVRGIFLVFLAMETGWVIYFQFIDDLLTQRFSFDRQSITVFVACLGLGFCFANGLVQPVLIKLFQFKTSAVFGLTATVVAMCVSLYLTRPIEQYGIAVIAGSVSATASASIITMLSKTVSDSEQGWIFGMLGAATALSWACASFLAGILDNIGPLAPIAMAIAFVAMAAVGMISQADPVRYNSSKKAGR
jgi:predicted MFS family arabinose efflux permease